MIREAGGWWVTRSSDRVRSSVGSWYLAGVTNPWVCIDCGHLQPETGRCGKCSHDDTLDVRDVKVRELMRDVEQRLTDRREGRLRFLGVGIGMAAVICLWMVPGYWTIRQGMALPLFMDQLILMALIGFGVIKLLMARAKKRFPYLRDDLAIA